MSFAVGIKRIMGLSLPEGKETLRDLISDCVRDLQENRKKITQSKIPNAPVRVAIGFICGRGGRWPAVYNKVEKFLMGKNPMNLLKRRELNSFLSHVYTQRGGGHKNAKKITRFLTALEDLDHKLKQWSKNERLEKFEQEFEKILKEKAKIGRKGRDNIMRDCGYLKRIPIDVHEQRFLVRTGIFHKYSSLKESDHTDYDHLAEVLKRFCKEELKELELNGISLSNAPGVADLIIWYFSQEKTEQEISLGVCAKEPKCDECPLKENLCLFAKYKF